MKRILSIILVVVMILSASVLALVSCDEPNTGDKGEGGDKGNGGNRADRIPLELPESAYAGYDGATYNILEWACGGQENAGESWIPWEEGDVDQLDGGMLTQAVFDRNAWVEQEFSVNITKEYASVEVAPSHITRMRENAQTTSNAYQLVTQRSRNLITMVQEELMYDMNQLDGTILHTDQPWWVQNSVESYTLGDKLYVACTELLLRDKGATAALYFNQTMAAEYDGLPNFFELVDNMEWTFDAMIEACVVVSHSADGDDLMNSGNDIWGMIGGDDPVFFLYAATGRQFAHIDGGGYLEYDFGYDPTSITVMKEIYENVMYSDWYLNTATDGSILDAYEGSVFVDGQALFAGGMVKSLNEYKEMEDLYGILPYPKYDLDQEGYNSLVWIHHDSVLGIPYHIDDAEMSAVILEAMSWESYYRVYPTFYETILLDRSAKDEDSKRMLKLVFETRIYDPGQYWDTVTGLQHGQGLLRLTARESSDIASVWAEFQGAVEQCVKDINKMIDSMEE